MTDAEEHVMTVHKMAAETITRMDEQARMIAEVWKHFDEKIAYEAVMSCSRNVAQLFNTFFGSASRITKDGPLSLFVSTSSGFVYGVIFHPSDYRVDTPEDDDLTSFGPKVAIMGRYCMNPVAGDDREYCVKPYKQGEPTCEGHTPLPAALPRPGTWSFHS